MKNDPLSIPIGETIYRIRNSMGITHMDLQRATGIHRNTLLRIEKGIRPPSFDVLHKIALAFDIELWRMLRYAQKITPVGYSESKERGITSLDKRAKQEARYQLKLAVQRGDVMRKPCEICGDVMSEAHHEDYSKPLEIRWLCDPHHKERHRQMRDEHVGAALKMVRDFNGHQIAS